MSMIVHTGRSSSSTSSRPRLKLLVAKQQSGRERVVSAEAYNDAVDFLFSLLSLPVITAVNMLTRDPMAGCVENLYRSVQTLPDSYFRHRHLRAALLSNHRSSTSSSRFVIGAVTYMVKDNLEITPPSNISAGMAMLNTRGDVAFRKMDVELGHNEAVQILKQSLVSKTVLTDVFLPARSIRRVLTPA